jgi:ABC-2 type transport system permease protein
MGVTTSLRLVGYVAWARAMQRIRLNSLFFYLLVWTAPSIFSALTVVFIYRGSPDLRDYAIVGGAGLSLLFAMQYNAGQALDEARRVGTLGNLFVSPGARYVWLAGFQLFAGIESLVAATFTVAVCASAFGMSVAIDFVSLAVTLLLLLACMWGFSMVVGSIGLALRDANQLSNLLFPLMTLVAGTMYPIALMPDWVRIPARCLPFGYAMQAMVDSVVSDASLTELRSDLLPLAAFAVVLPLLGIAAFRAVERRVRMQGTLELI